MRNSKDRRKGNIYVQSLGIANNSEGIVPEKPLDDRSTVSEKKQRNEQSELYGQRQQQKSLPILTKLGYKRKFG